MRMLLLPMMPQFPWAGSASRPDPREVGRLLSQVIPSFIIQTNLSLGVLCLAFSGLWGYRRTGRRKLLVQGIAVPYSILLLDWPFTASWEPLRGNLLREQSLYHWFVHFMLASNTHLERGTRYRGEGCRVPTPPEAHILVKRKEMVNWLL